MQSEPLDASRATNTPFTAVANTRSLKTSEILQFINSSRLNSAIHLLTTDQVNKLMINRWRLWRDEWLRRASFLFKFSTVGNDNWRLGLATVHTLFFHLLDDVETLYNLAKDNMFAIQMSSLDCADEELGTVGVPTSVGHWESARLDVLESEVLVRELFAIYRLSTSAVVSSEVATWKIINSRLTSRLNDVH